MPVPAPHFYVLCQSWPNEPRRFSLGRGRTEQRGYDSRRKAHHAHQQNAKARHLAKGEAICSGCRTHGRGFLILVAELKHGQAKVAGVLLAALRGRLRGSEAECGCEGLLA